MMTTPQATMSERIAALSDTDLSTRPAEVWAIALEAERAGVATGIVDALLDPKSPSVVRERALALVGAALVLNAPTTPVTPAEVNRAMVAARL